MDKAKRGVEEPYDDSESETSGLSDEDSSWISWFCNLRGNEFFCEVDEDFIQDEFNLTGLSSQVPYYGHAMDAILDIDSPAADSLTEEQQEMVDSAAELLYGLIHARYIITSRGLNAMHEKFQEVDFGRCHRVYCQGQPVLPVGQSDIPRKATVNVYCPKCNDIYFPKSSRQGNIDGAYFGATFPHLFIMTYPAVVPSPPTMVYVPRVFGFRIHKETKRDQVSTARQEAAEKMEQLSLRNRKGSPAPGAGIATSGGATAGASSAGAPAPPGPADAAPGAGGRADRGPKL